MLALLKFVERLRLGGRGAGVPAGARAEPGQRGHLRPLRPALLALERYDEAIALQKRARELDPMVRGSDRATLLLRRGRYEEARLVAATVVEFDPNFARGHATLGWACLKLGMNDRGIAALRKAVAISPGETLFLAQLGQALASLGTVSEAKAILQKLEELSRSRYVSPVHLAYVQTGLGEADAAIDLLEQAFEERAGGMYGIKGSFLFAPLREQPRFKALLQRMNLGG